MQRSLLQVVLRQRHRIYSRFLPTIHFRIHRPSKNWSEIWRGHTRAASIFSTALCTKSLLKREPFVCCACGLTMNERANRSTHADTQHQVAASRRLLRAGQLGRGGGATGTVASDWFGAGRSESCAAAMCLQESVVPKMSAFALTDGSRHIAAVAISDLVAPNRPFKQAFQGRKCAANFVL